MNSNRQIYLNVWGNMLFGYIGFAEGFLGAVLNDGLKVLGKYHYKTFDNPGNVLERQMGYDLYNGNKNGVTYQEVGKVIGNEISKFGNKERCDVIAYPGIESATCKTSSAASALLVDGRETVRQGRNLMASMYLSECEKEEPSRHGRH